MIKWFLVLSLNLLIINPRALASYGVDPYSIRIRLYRSFPPINEFHSLFELSKITAEETARGFLKYAVIDRDSFHMGATFCLSIDPQLGDADDVLQRILKRVSSLEPKGQLLQYEVTNPVKCPI